MSGNMKFVGPAQKKFNSIEDQAEFFMGHYCPKWKVSQSYFFPPVFQFQLPDVSDKVFKDAENSPKRTPEQETLLKHRRSDKADHIIYQGIETVIQENIQSPFIAIRNLNLADSMRHLKQIFPNLQWESWTDLRTVLEEAFKNQLVRFFPMWDQSRRQEFVADFQQDIDRLLGNVIFDEFYDNLECYFREKMIDVLHECCQEQLAANLQRSFASVFREYDYILIGPKIGIVVIEVKHSHFTQSISRKA